MLSFQLTFPKENADSKIKELSFIFCAVYLLLGMALIAMCFNLMQVCHSILFLFAFKCNEHKKAEIFYSFRNKNHRKAKQYENAQCGKCSVMLSP